MALHRNKRSQSGHRKVSTKKTVAIKLLKKLRASSPAAGFDTILNIIKRTFTLSDRDLTSAGLRKRFGKK